MDFLIGSGPIGSYTNGSGLGLVWSGPTSEGSNLIGYQTRPDPIRSNRVGGLISIMSVKKDLKETNESDSDLISISCLNHKSAD